MKHFAVSELGDVVCLETKEEETRITKYFYEAFPLSLMNRGFKEDQKVVPFLFTDAPFITYELYCKIHQIVPRLEKPGNVDYFENLEVFLNKNPLFTSKWKNNEGVRLFRILKHFLSKTSYNVSDEVVVKFLKSCQIVLENKINTLDKVGDVMDKKERTDNDVFIELLKKAFN
jgi:hypothetical protein